MAARPIIRGPRSVFEEAVVACRVLAGAQWQVGDWAIKVSAEAKYGEHTLERFGDEIGVLLSTLQHWRWTAEAWPELFGRPNNLSVGAALAKHPDRLAIIKSDPDLTVAEARAMMASYGAGLSPRVEPAFRPAPIVGKITQETRRVSMPYTVAGAVIRLPTYAPPAAPTPVQSAPPAAPEPTPDELEKQRAKNAVNELAVALVGFGSLPQTDAALADALDRAAINRSVHEALIRRAIGIVARVHLLRDSLK
jgi:hypothetical protein